MKTWTVDGSAATEGIVATMTPYPHIGLGETGRGRSYARFPVSQQVATAIMDAAWAEKLEELNRYRTTPRTWAEWEADTSHSPGVYMAQMEQALRPRVRRASVVQMRGRTELVAVQERDGDTARALVKVAISGGYRGRNVLTEPVGTVGPCPTRGQRVWDYARNREGAACCKACGAVLESDSSVPGLSPQMHPATGEMVRYGPLREAWGIRILASGDGAEGAAGNAGGPHTQALVIMEPGAELRVERHGRLYGAPSVLHVLYDGTTVLVGEADVVHPPAGEPEGALI